MDGSNTLAVTGSLSRIALQSHGNTESPSVQAVTTSSPVIPEASQVAPQGNFEYFSFQEELKRKLVSASANTLNDLRNYLAAPEIEMSRIYTSLEEIVGDTLQPSIKQVINTHFAGFKTELLELLQPTYIKSSELGDHSLLLTGNTVVFSQIIPKILERCQWGDIFDVYVIGNNVKLDTDIVLHGINLAIGANSLQFLTKSNQEKIIINLSGLRGEDGHHVSPTPALDKKDPGEEGTSGMSGKNGFGGQPGGDLLLKSKQIIDFDSDHLKLINLNGGAGGNGSSGQPGGPGADGKKGEDASQEPNFPTPSTGFINVKEGGKAIPAGNGGRGGNAGIGGNGGIGGVIYLESTPTDIVIVRENGLTGTDGEPGAGGKPGKPEPDGVGIIVGKPGIFGKQWTLRMIKPEHNGDMFHPEGWRETMTLEESRMAHSGKNGERGLTAEEQRASRHAVQKHGLNVELFNANFEKYLS